jgi:hypothetical protein
MICKKCALAGDMTGPLGSNPDKSDSDVRKCLEIAEELHSKCKGDTWCDCLHRVEKKSNVGQAK